MLTSCCVNQLVVLSISTPLLTTLALGVQVVNWETENS